MVEEPETKGDGHCRGESSACHLKLRARVGLLIRSIGILLFFVTGSSTGITRSRHARLCGRKGEVDLGLPRCVVYDGETRGLGRVGSAKSTGAGDGRRLLEDGEV